MLINFPRSLDAVLLTEGGFVNDPRDPGGATNKGVTIGTLKRLGIDVDGDGDSDIVDLKALRPVDLQRVYKPFYWDAVRGDLLPSGLDYAVFDFAVNSGPSRAAMKLQGIVRVDMDGDIGPKTIAAVDKCDPLALITAYAEARLAYMRIIRHPTTHALLWKTYSTGWTRRVNEVTALARIMAQTKS